MCSFQARIVPQKKTVDPVPQECAFPKYCLCPPSASKVSFQFEKHEWTPRRILKFRAEGLFFSLHPNFAGKNRDLCHNIPSYPARLWTCPPSENCSPKGGKWLISMVKRLILGRNNVSRVRFEPRLCDLGRRKKQARSHNSATGGGNKKYLGDTDKFFPQIREWRPKKVIIPNYITWIWAICLLLGNNSRSEGTFIAWRGRTEYYGTNLGSCPQNWGED